MRTGPESILRLIAIAMGLGIVAMAGLEFQRALESEAADRPAAVVTDPDRKTLRRCRALAPMTQDTECQAAWAENRRRFFGVDPDCDEVD